MPAAFDLRFSKRPVMGLIVLACLLAAIAYLSPHGRLSELNRLIQDFALTAKHRPLQDDIVIVAIDNRSIEALGRWPWRRAYHAELLDRIGAAGWTSCSANRTATTRWMMRCLRPLSCAMPLSSCPCSSRMPAAPSA